MLESKQYLYYNDFFVVYYIFSVVFELEYLKCVVLYVVL